MHEWVKYLNKLEEGFCHSHKLVAIFLKLDVRIKKQQIFFKECELVRHKNFRALLADELLTLEQDVININYRKYDHFINILVIFMDSHAFVTEIY